jgi:hypothetical protein
MKTVQPKLLYIFTIRLPRSQRSCPRIHKLVQVRFLNLRDDGATTMLLFEKNRLVAKNSPEFPLPCPARVLFCFEEGRHRLSQSLYGLGLCLVRFQQELRFPLHELCVCNPLIACFGAFLESLAAAEGMWTNDIERAPGAWASSC